MVSVHTFSVANYVESQSIVLSKQLLTWPNQLNAEDQIISEVAWVGPSSLLVKEVDRASEVGNVILFTDGSGEGKVVRKMGKDGEQGDDGWIDAELRVKAVPGWPAEGYLDVIPNNGYNHIAFFSPLDSGQPIWLTSGEWEVTSIEGVNASTGQV